MQLTDILAPQAVKSLAGCSSKKRLFQDVGDLTEAALGILSARAVEALMERESLGPTGVGHGVALPHARLPEISKVQGVFLRLDKPVEFGSVDRKPVDLVFALFAPEDAGVEHLKALALVSRTLKDEAIRTKLRANSDPATLHAVLTEAQATQAA
ncbi:PTS sugar transporter subunit IIA [Donghicola tyrosinivorans]|uniref:PTS system nitrogen regulatory IIA component n=1 Tax=Donghicola tyrosinivorans TaxID=1652492 RepID=A0A2T0WY78_9RHOB|nr:PTS sugar transporter subunit IIA [Donghicola tyrosinivorans]PRY91650.1 PTS system nitrogen regulatory IIA component [Donghicola tyrosinivorans]